MSTHCHTLTKLNLVHLNGVLKVIDFTIAVRPTNLLFQVACSTRDQKLSHTIVF